MLQEMPHRGEQELSDLDREIINLDAQGKSKTKKFNKLWQKKDQAQPPAETPEEIRH